MSNRIRERRSGRLSVAKLLRAVVEELDRRVLLSAGPGNPDPTFNTIGRVDIATSGPVGSLQDLAQRSNGTSLVLTNAAGPTNLLDAPSGLRLTNLLANADLDTSFGNGNGFFSFNAGIGVRGARVLDLGVGNGVFIAATVYEPVVAGTGNNATGDFLLIKLTDSGLLDSNFGGGSGFRRYDLDAANGSDILYSAQFDPSANRIVLAGTHEPLSGGPARHAFLRVDLAGNPDTGFGAPANRLPSGAFTETIDGLIVNTHQSLFVNPDGSFYSLSNADPGFLVKKFDAAGLRVLSFDGSDSTVGRRPNGIVANASNVFVVGTFALDAEVSALAATTGLLDTAFGDGGHTRYSELFSAPFTANTAAISLRGSGGLTVAAIGTDSGDPAGRVFGMTTTGLADSSFLADTLFDAGPDASRTRVPVVTSSATSTLVGAPVLAPLDPIGPTDVLLGSAVTRLTSNGVPDTTFNTTGTLVLAPVPGGLPTNITAAHVNAAGRTFSAFTIAGPLGGNKLGFAVRDRFGNFITQTETGAGFFRNLDHIAGVVEQSDDHYLVFFSAIWTLAGFNNRVLMVGRINAQSGLPDPDFGQGGFSFVAPLGDTDYTANTVLVSNLGSIYVGGSTGNNRAIFAFDVFGDLIPSFGTDGILQLFGPGAATYNALFESQDSGFIHGVATRFDENNGEVLVDQITSSGILSTNWGTSGTVTLPLPTGAIGLRGGAGIVADTSTVYIGGSAILSTGRRPFLARLDRTNGSLITGYASNGFNLLAPAATSGNITGIVPDRNGPVSDQRGFIVAGESASKPLVARITAVAGALDTNYAPGFQNPPQQTGRFNGILLDAAARPMPFGTSTRLLGVPQVGTLQRLGAFEAADPRVLEFNTLPRPRPGDAFGLVSLTLQAPPGLRIDTSTLAHGLRYVGPQTPPFQFQVAQLASTELLSPDASRVRVTYRYFTTSGNPFTSADAGNYAFFTTPPDQPEVIRDDAGNPLQPQSAFNVLLDFSGLPGPGDIDTTYNGGQGAILAGDTLAPGFVVDTLALPSGQTLLLSHFGASNLLPFPGLSAGLAVTRLNANGDLDTSFGTGGRAFFNYRSGVRPVSMHLAPDGSLFVVGNAFDGNTLTPDFDGVAVTDALVVKFTEDGLLDPAFGGSGFRVIDVSGSGSFDSVAGGALLGDGSVIVYGQTNRPDQNGVFLDASGFFVLKLTAAGSVVQNYGESLLRITSGALFFDSQSVDFLVDTAPRTAAVDANDNLYIAGRGLFTSITSVLALDPAGLPLFAPVYFNTVNDLLPVRDTRIVFDPVGSLVLAQRSFFNDIFVTRVGLNLIADNTFGTASGRFTYNIDSGQPFLAFTSVDLAIAADRTIYVAGGYNVDANPTNNRTNVAAFSLTPAGALNTAFNGGTVTFDSQRTTLRVSVSAHDRLAIAVGRAADAPSFPQSQTVVLRYTPTGAFDTAFDNATLGPGRVVPADALATAPASTQALHYNPLTGEAFAVSVSFNYARSTSLTFRRIDPNGAALSEGSLFVPAYTSYQLLGVFPLPGGGWILASTVRDADNNLNPRLAFTRFLADGTVDLAFGTAGTLQPAIPGNPSLVNFRAATLNADGTRIVLAGAIGLVPALLTTDLAGQVIGSPIIVNAAAADSYLAITLDPATGGYYLALAPDLNIVRDPSGGPISIEAVVERRAADLTLDPSFGNAGRIAFRAAPEFAFTLPNALAVDPARNRLLVGGQIRTAIFSDAVGGFLRAFNAATGAPASSFNTLILQPRTTLGGVNAIALDTDGDYLLAASLDGLPRLLKANPFGSLDQNYGQNSLPPTSILGAFLGVTLDNQGSPLAYGFTVQNAGAPQPGILQRFIPSSAPAPTAAFLGVNPINLPFAPTNAYLVTITYTAAPGRTIDPASISPANLRLLLNGVEGGQIDVLSTSSPTPNSVEVIYTFTPPSGGFGFDAQGLYEFLLSSASPVRDNAGQPVVAGPIGSFTLTFSPVSVNFITPPLPPVGSNELLFTIVYVAGTGETLDQATLGNDNITVLGPGGTPLTVQYVGFTLSAGGIAATYRLLPPGGAFDPASAGTYQFLLGPSPVRDTRNTPPAPDVSLLGSLAVQFTRPTASLTTSPVVRFGDAFAELSILFSPPTGGSLDLASIDGNEILITRPDGSTVLASFVSATPITSGPNAGSVLAVFRFSPVQSTFDFASTGAYAINLLANTFLDTAGQSNLAATLATLNLAFPRPTATAVAPNPPAPGATAVPFTLTLTPAPGQSIDPASLTGSSVRVTRPDGSTAFATLLATTPGTNGSLVATFSFTSASGIFDAAAAGNYTLDLLEGGARDDRAVPVASTTLFTLTFVAPGQPGQLVSVSIAPGPYAPGSGLTPSVVLQNPLSADPTQPFTLRFFLVLPSGTLTLGDIPISPLAPGQTLPLSLAGRLALPNAATVPAGTYVFGARILAANGTPADPVFAQQTLTILAPAAPRPGTLDPEFGNGSGVVTTFVPGPTITLVGSVALPGSIIISGGYNSDGDFVLLRFLADGTRDLTFGNAGQVTLDVTGNFDLATTITSDPQGRIVLGGTSVLNDTTVFTVVRFNPDGSLDTSFATAGILLYTPPGSQASFLRGVQTDRFGRPYLLGSVRAPQTPGGPVLPQGVVIRLTPLGTVDTSFGSRGVVSAALTSGRPGTLPFNDGQSELTSLLLLRDRIVLGGYSANTDGSASRFLLTALRYDGQLDTRFGRNGAFDAALGSTQDRITTLTEAPNGSIYAAGSRGTPTGSTAVIFRITANGRIDRAFNRGQPRILDTLTTFGTVSSVTPSVNNSVLITVATANSLADAAAGLIGTVAFRLAPNGADDPTFNGGNPLLIFGQLGSLTTFNATPITGDFDSFVQSKQGATQRVEGGRIRSLAATPVTDGTAISIAQLSADGADLLVLLNSNLPDAVRPGTRGVATLTLSNIGSLAANGRFSLTLVAGALEGADITLLLRNQAGRLAPGASRNLRINFTLPRNTPDGTYVLQATLTPINFTDINLANNTVTRPGEFTVSPNGTLRIAPATPSGLRSILADDPDHPRSALAQLFSDQPLHAWQ